NKYTLLIDGGSTEHIFNVSAAYQNIMNMVSVGGHVIFLAPTNNYCGHGFYQFSPEFFYSLFCAENGFEVKIAAYTYGKKLWIVSNPIELGKRVHIDTCKATLLCVCAKKIADTPKLTAPQQSDYKTIWQNGNESMYDSKFVKLIKPFVPLPLRKFIKYVISKSKEEKKRELKLI
ncbi:MAG: hypothetical protein FWE68_01610, partial [Defluviitaleaceae bacterium]|nr:hypothetical protein [Defluviitaleaceae bacterium]